MNTASGQCCRVFSIMFSVPTAFTSKSVNGSRAAQSCDGCAAVWMTSAMSVPYVRNNSSTAGRSRMSRLDVGVAVAEFLLEGRCHPRGRRILAEEHLAHVVVDPDDMQAESGKMLRSLGSDEACGSGDEGNRHVCSSYDLARTEVGDAAHGLELVSVWRERVMTWFRPTNIDLRTDEFRDLVRRSREVVLLAAVTGAITGIGVYFFEYFVTEVLLHHLYHADWKWGLIVPGLGLVASALILSTIGSGASPATSDEYLRAFHDSEYPLRWRAFVGRIAAAVTTLGSGGAMGLEGPSMYGGSAIGAMIQRRLPAYFRGADYRTLLVAGSAAGVAAIFKAPATGAIFALEVPFRDQMARRMLLPRSLRAPPGI